MAFRSPWAQPGKELGWENGASELDPPTKQQQEEEENLQLAIAAAVAPDTTFIYNFSAFNMNQWPHSFRYSQ